MEGEFPLKLFREEDLGISVSPKASSGGGLGWREKNGIFPSPKASIKEPKSRAYRPIRGVGS